MPTYKNLIINGQIVKLVNGKFPKDITINGETYTPEQSGPVVGGRYKHLVYIWIGRQYDKSGTRPVYTKENALKMQITFYSDDETPITSIDQIPDGEYPRVDDAGDLKQYMLASDNPTSSYGYIIDPNSSSSRTYNKVSNLVIENTIAEGYTTPDKYATFIIGTSTQMAGYLNPTYTTTGWKPTPNFQTTFGMGSSQGSNYSWHNGIQSDTVTDTQS